MQNHVWEKVAKNTKLFLKRSILLVYAKIFEPKSRSEDEARKEFIFNIIISALLLISIIFGGIIIEGILDTGPAYKGIPLHSFLVIVAIFAALLVMSRYGYYKIASYVLIGTYFIGVTYTAYHWGIDLPIVLLSFSLVIVITSILLSLRAGLFLSILIAVEILSFGYAHVHGIMKPAVWWKTLPLRIDNAIEYSTLIFFTMLISWLYNREIERSLRRARKSEAELKHERDLLEVKVEERTIELKKTQAEKMSQLYRFAEFGRLSSGVFHDLINPLTGVAMSIQQIEETKGQDLQQAKKYLENGIVAARRMEGFIQTIRRQLSKQDIKVSFSLNEEIHQVMQMFEYKARQAKVDMHFVRQHEVQTFGNPLQFHQVVANLISNGIDAYDGLPKDDDRKRAVEIRLAQHGSIVRLEVQDWGKGIEPEIAEKIFEPFFTTKNPESGTGIGLSTTKHVVEKGLGGTVRMESQVAQGSTFIVEFAV